VASSATSVNPEEKREETPARHADMGFILHLFAKRVRDSIDNARCARVDRENRSICLLLYHKRSGFTSVMGVSTAFGQVYAIVQ
jgi:hypothetical protein